MSDQPVRTPAAAAGALVIGVIAVSSAAILISFARAQGIAALAIAALRMALAAAVVAPIALLRTRAEIRALTPSDAALGVLSGIFLALHFGFWTSSLDSTSVMSSVVLVSTSPLFVGAASALLFRERLRAGTLIGIGAAIAGSAAVALLDWGPGGSGLIRGDVGALHGDILALFGAVSASGYLLVGRRLRSRMSLSLYVGISYVTAAVALLGVAALTATRLAGFPMPAYFWVFLLALGPQLLGHTSYNYALKYVSATFVTVTMLGEPIGASLLAIPLLAQVPSALRIAAGLCILAGIVIAARAEAGRRAQI